jgi:hypothetical protein
MAPITAAVSEERFLSISGDNTAHIGDSRRTIFCFLARAIQTRPVKVKVNFSLGLTKNHAMKTNTALN